MKFEVRLNKQAVRWTGLVIGLLLALLSMTPILQPETDHLLAQARGLEQDYLNGVVPAQVSQCDPLIEPQIVSRGSTALGVQGNEDSASSAVSYNGRWVAFRSEATNLVPNDTNNAADIFLRDLLTCDTTRISVSSSGTQANDSSAHPSMSLDGRFVVFHSKASNLAPNDSNHTEDVFLHDISTGQTTLISRAMVISGSPAVSANSHSWQPVISANGRWIAFASQANNLIAGDDNTTFDVFLYDRFTDQLMLVSRTPTGAVGDGESGAPSISGDGHYVAFASGSRNLVVGDTTGHADIYLFDRITLTVMRVSQGISSEEPNGLSTDPAISHDGRFIAYSSTADNIGGGDTEGCSPYPSCSDIFLYDREAGTTTLVSMTVSAVPTDGHSRNPSISGDGRFVIFDSDSAQLALGDTSWCRRTDLPPLMTNTPAPPNGGSTLTPTPTLCPTCATPTPHYQADSVSCPDIFLYDLQSGTVQLISAVLGVFGDERSIDPVISSDGRVLVFDSRASNLVSPDLNNHRDILALANPNPIPTAFAAPTNFTATGMSQSQIHLTWIDNSAEETGYQIERSLVGEFGYTLLTTVPANSTGYTDENLECGRTYYYRLRGVQNSMPPLYSQYGFDTQATTLNCIHPAPSNFSATAVTNGQVQLSWADNASDETEYRLERSSNWSAGWTQIATLPPDSVSYQDNHVACGTHYYYRLRGYWADDGQYSNFASVVEITTTACGLATPSDFSATTLSISRIQLYWTDNAVSESEYRLERSADGISGWIESTLPINSNDYRQTGLVCGTIYYFRLRAYQVDGDTYSPYSSIASATTYPCTLPTPLELQVYRLDYNTIDLQWTDSAPDETNFRLERSLDGVTGWAQIGTSSATTLFNTAVYRDDWLTCQTQYFYRVRSYRSEDNVFSDYSSVVNATTANCPVNAPNAVSAVAVGSSEIQLTWHDTSNDETEFRIERSRYNNTGYSEIGVVPANTTFYSDTTVACGIPYYYRVRAYRSVPSTYSDYSFVVSRSTSCSPLPAPTNTTATTLSVTQIQITWTDNATDETNYRIERSLDGSTGWLQIVSLSSNVTTYTNTGLTCGSTYYYRVRAYRSSTGTYSAYSEIAPSTTWLCAPLAPTSLTAIDQNTGQIQLTWIDNAADETEYRIQRTPNGSSSWAQIATVPSNATTYLDTGSTCGATYQYRVQAYRTSPINNSSYSNTATASVTCPPVATTTITATVVSATVIRLDWVDNAVDETDYRIERSPDGISGWSQISTTAANAITYTDSNLTCETSYAYRIRAYRDSDGSYSSYSNTVSATTALCLLLPPTNLRGTIVSEIQLRLTWADAAQNESAMLVERLNNGQWAQIANLPANTTAYTDTGLACGTEYQYRVRVYRSSNNTYSGYSNTLVIGTKVCTPDNLMLSNSATHAVQQFRSLQNPPIIEDSIQFSTGFPFGLGGQYVMADWDGNGTDTVGVYRNGSFFFTNDTGQSTTWGGIWFGLGGQPVVGRFDASVDHDCLGVTDSGTWTNGDLYFAFYFTCNLTSGPTPPLTFQWLSIVLPNSGGFTGTHQFAAGDFDSDGVDSIAIRRGNFIAWTNVPPTTMLSQFSLAQYIGAPGTGDEGQFVVGDWDLNHLDSFGLVYQNGWFYRRDDLLWNSGIYVSRTLTSGVGIPFGVTSGKPN